MEAILLRFPHIGYQIFEQLNNPYLTICRHVSKSWKNFIDNEKLPWIRMIIQHIKPLKPSWRIFFQKSNVNFLVEMATSVIQHFEELECDPENTGLTNTVPLHFAAMTDNTEMIKRLIQIGAKLNEIDSFQCTPLHYAAHKGHLTAYQAIMEINPTKNPECGYMTPFHMAAKHGHLRLCKLIIDNVEDKNPKNVDDETPLHYAAEGGFLEICQLIIDNVIDKNPRDQSGQTPLHYSINSSNLEIYKLFSDNLEDKNPQADNGVTPLHLFATNCENLETYKWIMDNIKDKNPRDGYGNTPLHCATASVHEQLSLCQLILENVADKNPPTDVTATTPLHQAAEKGHYDICKLFMEKIEEKSPQDIEGITPLLVAARNGHLKIYNMMLGYIRASSAVKRRF